MTAAAPPLHDRQRAYLLAHLRRSSMRADRDALELQRMPERRRRRGGAPVRLVLTRRALEDPVHGQCGVCLEPRRLQQLVILDADELAVCRATATRPLPTSAGSGGHPLLFELEDLP